MFKPITAFIFFILLTTSGEAQDCEIKSTAFQYGERVNYTIYYHLAGIWVSAGEVYFQVDSANFGNKDYYYFNSYGQTFKKYDWVYKVRDQYESYVRRDDFSPLRFKRQVNEGSTHIREDYIFNSKKNAVYTLRQMKKDVPFVKDTIAFENCAYDVLSMIYFARNIDFGKYKKGDKIPIKILIDNEIHESYIRFIGREELKVKDLGKFNTIKFSPLLIEGTIFNAGEDMTVWVTDDENKVPLLIETPILVGSIRARLSSTENLRHTVKSRIRED
jgi:hypothetical protein